MYVAEQTAFVSSSAWHCHSLSIQGARTALLAVQLPPPCHAALQHSAGVLSFTLPLSVRLSLSHKSHLRPCECANAPNRQINLVQKYLKVYLLSACVSVYVCIECVCVCGGTKQRNTHM